MDSHPCSVFLDDSLDLVRGRRINMLSTIAYSLNKAPYGDSILAHVGSSLRWLQIENISGKRAAKVCIFDYAGSPFTFSIKNCSVVKNTSSSIVRPLSKILNYTRQFKINRSQHFLITSLKSWTSFQAFVLTPESIDEIITHRKSDDADRTEIQSFKLPFSTGSNEPFILLRNKKYLLYIRNSNELVVFQMSSRSTAVQGVGDLDYSPTTNAPPKSSTSNYATILLSSLSSHTPLPISTKDSITPNNGGKLEVLAMTELYVSSSQSEYVILCCGRGVSLPVGSHQYPNPPDRPVASPLDTPRGPGAVPSLTPSAASVISVRNLITPLSGGEGLEDASEDIAVSERSSFVAARSVDSATRPGGFKRVLPGSGLTLREVLHVEDDTRTSAPTPWRSHFPHPLPKGEDGRPPVIGLMDSLLNLNLDLTDAPPPVSVPPPAAPPPNYASSGDTTSRNPSASVSGLYLVPLATLCKYLPARLESVSGGHWDVQECDVENGGGVTSEGNIHPSPRTATVSGLELLCLGDYPISLPPQIPCPDLVAAYHDPEIAEVEDPDLEGVCAGVGAGEATVDDYDVECETESDSIHSEDLFQSRGSRTVKAAQDTELCVKDLRPFSPVPTVVPGEEAPRPCQFVAVGSTRGNVVALYSAHHSGVRLEREPVEPARRDEEISVNLRSPISGSAPPRLVLHRLLSLPTRHTCRGIAFRRSRRTAISEGVVLELVLLSTKRLERDNVVSLSTTERVSAHLHIVPITELPYNRNEKNRGGYTVCSSPPLPVRRTAPPPRSPNAIRTEVNVEEEMRADEGDELSRGLLHPLVGSGQETNRRHGTRSGIPDSSSMSVDQSLVPAVDSPVVASPPPPPHAPECRAVQSNCLRNLEYQVAAIRDDLTAYRSETSAQLREILGALHKQQEVLGALLEDRSTTSLPKLSEGKNQDARALQTR